MQSLVLVFLGGGAGACARYGLSAALAWSNRDGASWPWATFAANVGGGLAMGVLVAWLMGQAPERAETWRLLLGVGLLGGFTTFSSFSLEAVQLFQAGAAYKAAAYVVVSALASVTALALGYSMMRAAAT